MTVDGASRYLGLLVDAESEKVRVCIWAVIESGLFCHLHVKEGCSLAGLRILDLLRWVKMGRCGEHAGKNEESRAQLYST